MSIRVPALSLAVAGLLMMSACADELPSHAVARVGDQLITKAEYDRWFAAGGSFPKNCGRAASPVQKSSSARRSPDCRRRYEAAKREVMRFLITAAWTREEAERRRIAVSAEEIARQREADERRFPDPGSYRRWVAASGLSDADLRAQYGLAALAEKLREDVVTGVGEVTDAQIASYYTDNRARFTEPERRQITGVTKRSRAEAQRARGRAEAGRVMRGATELLLVKGSGSALNRREPALAGAVFGAREGELIGPIRTRSGYRVFRVTRIAAAKARSLGELRDALRAQLVAEQERRAVDRFTRGFRARYREETQCAQGFVVADCQSGKS